MRLRQHATIGLAAITALVSLGLLATASVANAASALGFIAARLGGLVVDPAAPFWLTPLTSTLVHADLLHLFFNGVLLVYCGRQVESILGAGPLVVLYLVGAFAAAAGQFALDPASPIPMIGASGAISAVVGAYAMSFGKPKRIVNSLRLNRWINIAWLMAGWIAIQAMVGYVAGQNGVLIAVGGHVGGFIAGLLLQRPLLLWRYRGA